MPTLTVDGRTVTVREGAFVLEAVRAAGVNIPTLCHHEAVEPYGGCRLCVVDVTRKDWDGWNKLVVACLFPVEEGLIVLTDTPRVISVRKVVLDLLLARSPHTPLIRELAASYGITKTSYVENPEPTDCILCGLCTRVCDTLGPSAIASVNRGSGREIAPPFHKAPPDCIGCLSCAYVCPTRCIPFASSDSRRTIWDKEFEMVRCPDCGRSHITVAQANYFSSKNGLPVSYYERCDACKRAALADQSAQLAVR